MMNQVSELDPSLVSQDDMDEGHVMLDERKPSHSNKKRSVFLCNIKIALLDDMETYVRCPIQCADELSLKHHRASHKGEKRFRCKECGYRTANGGHLKEHYRSKHTQIKPYRCPECDYSAARMSHLKQHMVKHSGEKPYACDHCDSKFSRRSHLQVHLRTHTGEKPFACEHCDYCCTEKGRLRRHVSTVHQNPKFSCSDCDFKCSQIGSLNLHMAKEHGYCARCRRDAQGLTGNKNWGAHTCSKRRPTTGMLPKAATSRIKTKTKGTNGLLQQNILRFERNKKKLKEQERMLKQLEKQQKEKEKELAEKERLLQEREMRLMQMSQEVSGVEQSSRAKISKRMANELNSASIRRKRIRRAV